jgi:hypothetical protein
MARLTVEKIFKKIPKRSKSIESQMEFYLKLNGKNQLT